MLSGFSGCCQGSAGEVKVYLVGSAFTGQMSEVEQCVWLIYVKKESVAGFSCLWWRFEWWSVAWRKVFKVTEKYQGRSRRRSAGRARYDRLMTSRNNRSRLFHWVERRCVCLTEWLKQSLLALKFPGSNAVCVWDLSVEPLCSPSREWIPGSCRSWWRWWEIGAEPHLSYTIHDTSCLSSRQVPTFAHWPRDNCYP